jgi:hypothetical protein
MARLENVSVEDLRQILAEVDEVDAAKRIMAAITYNAHSPLVNILSNIQWWCFWAEFRTITPATVRNSGLKQMVIA